MLGLEACDYNFSYKGRECRKIKSLRLASGNLAKTGLRIKGLGTWLSAVWVRFPLPINQYHCRFEYTMHLNLGGGSTATDWTPGIYIIH